MKSIYHSLFTFFVLLSLLGFSQQVFAQIPQQMNYQGAVRDAAGRPLINQDVTIRLSILDNGLNGLLQYTEVREVTTNAIGLYSVAIGNPVGAKQVQGAVPFAQIPWGSAPKFLKVEIDLDGGSNFTLAGITQLLSVPYALYAKYAESGLPGPEGPVGPQGPQGDIGYSGGAGAPGEPGTPAIDGAIDMYVDNNTGIIYVRDPNDPTLWLPLTGAQGPIGPQGPQGDIGYSGGAGAPGEPGTPAIDGAIDMYVDNNTGIIYVRDPNDATQWLPLTGAQGPQGNTGATGLSTLIKVTVEAAGASAGCLNGGNKVEQGLDLDRNGSLSPAEVSSTTFVCNGVDGSQGPIGLTGPTGAQGLQGQQGLAGPQGNPGPTGNTGATGLSTLIKVTVEAAGASAGCLNGGNKIQQGIDVNRDGILSDGEVTSTTFVCNGATGSSGTTTLTNTHIFVGNSSSQPVDVAMSGDATIANTGALTITDGAITTPKLADNAVSTTKIADFAVTNPKIADNSITTSKILDKAVGLSKMADGPPSRIYTTNTTGITTLATMNTLGWDLRGNSGTILGTSFIGTRDDQPISFRVNNEHAGRVYKPSGITSYGYLAGDLIDDTQLQDAVYIGRESGSTANFLSGSTFVGAHTGKKLANGAAENTFIGFSSGNKLTSGSHNTFIGSQTGANALDGGQDNTWIGFQAGLNSNNGINTVLIGRGASLTGSLTNATAIGANANVSANNSLVLGNLVNVGIGTTAPLDRLHVDGNIRIEDGVFTANPTTTATTSWFSAFAGGTTGIQAGSPGVTTNVRGRITANGANDTSSDTQLYLNFIGSPYTTAPYIIVTPANRAAANSDFYVINNGPGGTAGFTIVYRNRTANLFDASFNYWVIQ